MEKVFKLKKNHLSYVLEDFYVQSKRLVYTAFKLLISLLNICVMKLDFHKIHAKVANRFNIYFRWVEDQYEA